MDSTTSLPAHIETDKNGYLLDYQQWDESIAEIIATAEGIAMTAEHWQVVKYVRDFYLEFKKSPSIRPLVKYLKAKIGEEKASSLYLQMLFPEGPAKQATKIAGLPKPARCT